jgi:hypothetical protein
MILAELCRKMLYQWLCWQISKDYCFKGYAVKGGRCLLAIGINEYHITLCGTDSTTSHDRTSFVC